MTRSLSFLFVVLCAGSLNAQLKNDICQAENKSQALAKTLNLSDFVEKLAEARTLMVEAPLSNFEQVKAGLDYLYQDHQTQKEALSLISTAAGKLRQGKRELVDAVINGYLADLGQEFDEVSIMAAELPPEVQGEARLAQQEWVRGQLQELYKEQMASTLKEASELDEQDLKALNYWVFELLPEGPKYKTNQASQDFMSYMKGISVKHNMLTMGRVPNGIFTVQSMFTRKNPGLVATVTVKPSANTQLYTLIEFNESPFLNAMEVSVCEFGTGSGGCDLQPLNQWCDQ